MICNYFKIVFAGRAEQVTNHKGRGVAFQFGDAGECTGLTYPGGQSVEYLYDNVLRLETLHDGDREIHYKYDQNSRLAEKLFANGMHIEYHYGETVMLSELVHSDEEGVLDRLECERT